MLGLRRLACPALPAQPCLWHHLAAPGLAFLVEPLSQALELLSQACLGAELGGPGTWLLGLWPC